MPSSSPSLDQLKRALAIAEQIQKLEAEYAALLGGKPAVAPTSITAAAKPAKRGGKRTLSAEARAKMAAAAEARWAKKGRGVPPLVKTARKKRVLSAEGRARIVAAVKARHAAARKAK